MRKTQEQHAGDNSKQIIVAGDFNENLTIEQATEVAELVAHKVVAQEFAKADALGLVRMEKLNERVLNRLEALDKLSAFADPAFQVILRKAQIGAASTERDGDYEMLAELLTARVLRGEERPIRAGIDRAVQVVDHVDTHALIGLTVFQAATQFAPSAGGIVEGFGILDALFSQFPMSELPKGEDWIDHLEVLDALRLNPVGKLKRFEEYYPAGHTEGYLCPGVPTESVADVLGDGNSVILGAAVIDHELKPGYSRLGHPHLASLEQRLKPFRSAVEVDEVIRVAKEGFQLGQVDNSLLDAYMEKFDEQPNLRMLHTWWNDITVGIQVTAVGRVLATANAKRCDSRNLLPPLD